LLNVPHKEGGSRNLSRTIYVPPLSRREFKLPLDQARVSLSMYHYARICLMAGVEYNSPVYVSGVYSYLFKERIQRVSDFNDREHPQVHFFG